MHKKIVFIIALFISLIAKGQELNCTVVVNAQATGNENLQIFKTLQKQLTEFVSTTRWTDKKVVPQERIDCNMSINISSYSGETFSGSIQIQSSRPVYGSSFSTPVFNVNDKDFTFNYLEFQNLTYNPNQYQSNLVSVISFYVYIILGTDADTFSINGGDAYYKQAQNILNYTQQENYKGWKMEDGQQSRFALIDNILSPTYKGYREVLYNYHLKGLDAMSADLEEGKTAVSDALTGFDQLYRVRPNSYITRVFFDAKAEEIEQIFSGGPKINITTVVDLLNRVAPLHASKWRNIKY